MTNDVTFSKLRSGDWGVSGPVDMIESGSVVTVTKKSGATAKVTIGAIVWDNGETAVAKIQKTEKPKVAPKAPSPKRTDKPEPGKIYRLTGGRDTPSVARGDPLADCEVENESAVDLTTRAEFEASLKPSEPASEPSASWGVVGTAALRGSST
jgi:hypothetical protein